MLSIASGTSMPQFNHLNRGFAVQGANVGGGVMGLRALRAGRVGSFTTAAGGGGASGVLNVNPGGVLNTIAPSTLPAAVPQVVTTTDPGSTEPASFMIASPASTGDGADPNAAAPADVVGMATEPINATTLPAPGFGLNTIPESAPGVLLATGLMGGSDNALGLIGGGMDAFGALGGAIQFKIAAQAAETSTSSGDSGTTASTDDAATTADPLQADFEKFNADFQAITDKSTVTPVMLATVRKDFEAIQAAATSAPDEAKLQAFATDVSNLKGTLPTADQTAQLEASFTAVLNSEGVTDQALISKAIADVHAVIDATNVTADDLATLAADQEAIKSHTPDTPWGTPVLFDAAAQGGVPGDLAFSSAPVAISGAPGTDGGSPMTISGSPVTISAPTSAPVPTNFQVSTLGGPSVGSFSDYSKGSPAAVSVGNFANPVNLRNLAGRFSSGNFSTGNFSTGNFSIGRGQGGNNGAGAVSSSGSDGNGGVLYGVPRGLRGGNGPTGKFMFARTNGRVGF